MKPCRPHHGAYRPGCHVCYKAATDPRYAAVWGEPAPVEPAPPRPDPPPAPPCGFLGPELSAGEKCDRDKDTLRDWRDCRHPLQPLGPVVCPCVGCGPKCVRYSPLVHVNTV